MNAHHLSVLLCLLSGPFFAQGTSMVVGPHAGPATNFNFGTPKCAALNGAFTCFLSDDGGSATMLWRTDGTPAGTTLVYTIDAYTSADLEMVARNGLVFFSAPSRSSGIELWVTDGTVAGTVQDSTLLDPVLVRLPGGTRVLSRGLLVVDNNSATPHVDLYP